MLEFLQSFFASNSFIPHGHCYLWLPELVWLNITSDSLIFFSYFSISIGLSYFVQQRQDLPLKGIFLLFGAFILSCSTNHLIAVWTLWYPIYWTSSFIKALTTGISACTAVILVPIIPKVLANLSPAQLETANCKLKAEILEPTRIEEKLRSSQEMLQLVMDNIPQCEIKERVAAEEALRAANRTLQTVLEVGTSLESEEAVPHNDELHTYITMRLMRWKMVIGHG